MVSFPRRGEIYIGDLVPGVGHEQAGARPVLIVQNDAGNERAKTTIVVPITSNVRLARFPFVARIPDGVLRRPSVANCGQLRNLDKSRLSDRPLAKLDAATMAAVDEALRVSLGLW